MFKGMINVQNYGTFIKVAICTIAAWVSAKLGALAPVMAMLAAVMMLDFLSAWVRAYTTGEKLQSRKAAIGLVKKAGYLVFVAVGMVLDNLIVNSGLQWLPVFGVTAAGWLILTDIVSILENLHNSGINTPAFFGKIVKTMRDYVEKQGEQAAGQTALEQKYDKEGE